MSLHQTIPPEIFQDEFYDSIREISKRTDISSILEIGSSSGSGSTQAIVEGLEAKANPGDSLLFCMEVSRIRYLDLVNRYKDFPFVVPYNLSSISISEFPSAEQVKFFFDNTSTNHNHYPIEIVLGWLHEDLDYIQRNHLNYNGIDFIKKSNNINLFDFVLIDGSEFTGEAELNKLWDAKIIALDDVNAFKCFSCYVRLSRHYEYKPIKENLSLRNGYDIFERNY